MHFAEKLMIVAANLSAAVSGAMHSKQPDMGANKLIK
jgi:hypothetical protein